MFHVRRVGPVVAASRAASELVPLTGWPWCRYQTGQRVVSSHMEAVACGSPLQLLSYEWSEPGY